MLEQQTAAAGKVLVGRLALYPKFVAEPHRWLDAPLRTAVLRASDSEGYARPDAGLPDSDSPIPARQSVTARERSAGRDRLQDILDRAVSGEGLPEADIAHLFSAPRENFTP